MSSLDRRTLAFVIPVKDGDRVYKLYVPMPSRNRVENIAPILGHIFSVGESKKFSKAALLIVAKDYEYYAKEACQVNAKRIAVDELDVSRIADELLGQFRDFLQAVIYMAQVDRMCLAAEKAFWKRRFKTAPVAPASCAAE